VLDWKTHLTGVTDAAMADVTTTRSAVAARIAALLPPDAVLVGHGLHNDLIALQLDTAQLIDTSMLFAYK
jgi:RNA exonuclease 1